MKKGEVPSHVRENMHDFVNKDRPAPSIDNVMARIRRVPPLSPVRNALGSTLHPLNMILTAAVSVWGPPEKIPFTDIPIKLPGTNIGLAVPDKATAFGREIDLPHVPGLTEGGSLRVLQRLAFPTNEQLNENYDREHEPGKPDAMGMLLSYLTGEWGFDSIMVGNTQNDLIDLQGRYYTDPNLPETLLSAAAEAGRVVGPEERRIAGTIGGCQARRVSFYDCLNALPTDDNPGIGIPFDHYRDVWKGKGLDPDDLRHDTDFEF